MMAISKFSKGPTIAVRKLNEVIAQVNSLLCISGDNFIKVQKTAAGLGLRLNYEEIIRRMPKSVGSTSTLLVLAEVISMPSYPDPTADESSPEYAGRNYYTCRLISSQYAAWSSSTAYLINQYATYAEKLYKAKRNNNNCQPDICGDDWEEMEEIKIEYAIGSENIPAALTNCVPWFEVGEIVPLFSKVIEGTGTRYYILQTLMYAGEPEDATLRYNPDLKISQAVFQ